MEDEGSRDDEVEGWGNKREEREEGGIGGEVKGQTKAHHQC